jgi:N6-adenosine-specific RNA methylase IME4/ParB-like chromosome segregation protein Spo0J
VTQIVAESDQVIREALRLQSEGVSQRDIAARLGKSRLWVRYDLQKLVAQQNPSAAAILDTGAFEFHPLANLFPLIEGAEFDDLVADVKACGLREPVIVWQDKILDGRNRYRACRAAGITAQLSLFLPEVQGDALAFVISKNLKRRHLDDSQRAMVAADIANLDHGQRADRAANLPVLPIRQGEAAKMLSISERALRAARSVREHGEPELVRAVRRGRLAVSAASAAAKLAPDMQRRIAEAAEAGDANAARTVIKQQSRNVREAELGARQLTAPAGKFGVIVEDFEWDDEVWSRDTGMDRHASNHYPTSESAHTAEEIVERTKDRFACAAPDCVVFSWTTIQHLAIALDVMRLRGFTYKSHYVWGKNRITLGRWLRSKHEILLAGVCGNVPCPAPGTQWESLILAPVTGPHSTKPDCFLEMIEEYFPTLPKIELNARRARPGWQSWGLEAPAPARELPESVAP